MEIMNVTKGEEIDPECWRCPYCGTYNHTEVGKVLECSYCGGHP